MNEFLERYKQLGEEFEPEGIVIPRAIRINTLKANPEKIIKRLEKEEIIVQKVPYLDFGYVVESAKFSVGAATEHLLGYYYVQEVAAQIPVQVLNPKKNDTVLDMSAAPGGKTTQIAQYLENTGIIVALDTNQGRLLALRNNLERLGVTNSILYQKDAQFITDFAIKFDKVLLDAPCSGNFSIDEKWFDKRTVEGVKNTANVQKKLIGAAYDVLKSGGEMVYSTCSLEPEENEFIVDWALREFSDLKLQKINIPIGDNGITEPFGKKLDPTVKLCKRFWPHKTKTQGFFIAKFKKE